MILRSEGDKIKLCVSPPRDRKYIIAAFTNLVCNKPQSFLEDSLKTVIGSLVELSSKGDSASGGFSRASSVETNTEDMLNDGAIDQTFAFQRQSHV